MVEQLLRGNGPAMDQITKTAEKMDVGEALKRLEGKMPAAVPPEVLAFVHTDKKAALDDASIEKANNIVRNFIIEGWVKLDAKLLECKTFEDRNRGSYDQVQTDLARLAEEISDLERQRSEANENIQTKEMEFLQVKFELRKQTMMYMRIRWTNSQEMIIRKNDAAVFLFILRFTECTRDYKEVKVVKLTLAQVGHDATQCDCRRAPLFNLDDPNLKDQLNKMSPKAREFVIAAFNGVTASPSLSLLQSGTASQTIQDPAPPPASDRSPVQEGMGLDDMAKKCGDCVPDFCEEFHDKVSLLWGKYQDMVDELQAEMDRNEARFIELRANFITQLDIIKTAKGRYMMLLAEVISNLNQAQSQQSEKQQQKFELVVEFRTEMMKCKKEIHDIMCNDIVAWLCIRNKIMLEHTVTTTKIIQDCVVSYWVPSDCSVPCDDTCPTSVKMGETIDPYACGGWQTLTRHVVTAVPEFFVKYAVSCPKMMTTTRKCNQQKCPVDCEMSMWSGWSKCTKDCEGGVRSRTRGVLTKPMNGGESCNTVQETEPCNTGSCDRDCALHEWTEWGFCTMACTVRGPPEGAVPLQERVRRVDIPTRGEGVCPKDESAARFEERRCNTFDCPVPGPLLCIAQQDLIIAIDSSGSLKEFGFKTIQNFIHKLIDQYQAKYYGELAMQIGVVEFGNGRVEKDGTVTSAIEVVPLTNNMDTVKTNIAAMKYQGGFTNMAQALVLAESMLKSGRHKAQSAVLVVTDGKPTKVFETNQQVVKMKDAATKLFFAPVTSEGGADLGLMRHWSSQPWESHYVHVPGIYALKGSTSAFADRFIATFCPQAFDPSATLIVEKELGFFLLKTHAICGDPTQGNRLSTNLKNVGECAALTRLAKCGAAADKNCAAFSYGEWYRKGYCYSEHFTINEADIAKWQKGEDRANPTAPCDASSAGGTVPTTNNGWTYNPFYDTYVLETDTMSGGASTSANSTAR